MDPKQISEQVEILTGKSNRQAVDRAAVLIRDLTGLDRVNERLQATEAAGSAPTKAEHDALVKDVRKLHDVLFAMSKALTARKIR